MQGKNLRKTAKQSTRYSFIAEHRGGPLTNDNHRKLIRWARECSEHVLFLIEKDIDKRLIYALDVARKWENGDVPTGAAMKASLAAHAVAREVKDPVYKAIARSIGQTLATAHMADHSLGGAFYALKAIKLANKNIENERNWQTKKLRKLPSDIIEIVQSSWAKKALDQKI
ncbi:MAG: putative immunity protein [Bacteroidia bacterium]